MQNFGYEHWFETQGIGTKQADLGPSGLRESQPLFDEAPLDERQSWDQTKLPRQITHHLSNLNSRRRKHIWTLEENDKMLQLHDELGNKWSTISKQLPGKSDNDVKNHFFSRLRMALRNLNKHLSKPNLKKTETVKSTIIIKVTNLCEEQFNSETRAPRELIDSAIRIKQGLFNLLSDDEIYKKENFNQLVSEIKMFTAKTSKERRKRKQEEIMDDGQGEYFSPSQDDQILDNLFQTTNLNLVSARSLHESQANQENISQEIKPDLGRPEETSQLIARPSFCLENPFEQVQMDLDEGCFWFREIDEQNSNFSQFLYPFEFKSFEL